MEMVALIGDGINERANSKPSGSPHRFAAVRVILCRPSHPGNVGAVARAMKTMGFSRLLLVGGPALPDPQASARASGAFDVLQAARRHSSLAEALSGTIFSVALTSRRRELANPPLWARDAAAELARFIEQGEVALVFGNETHGLANEELALCSAWASIPADSAYASLNLAAAVQVMCYELRLALLGRSPIPAHRPVDTLAAHEEVEGLLAAIEAAAIASGFLDPLRPGRLMLRLRRLFARARLERNEVNILRGLLAALMRQRVQSGDQKA